MICNPKIFILNGFDGSIVRLDRQDRNLYEVLSRIAETADRDGYNLIIDQRISGKIEVNLTEPWNHILVEILAGLNLVTIIVRKTIIISLPL